MKVFISMTLIFLLVVLSSSQINFAQDIPSLPGKVERVLNTRTSPFSPPEDSDRSFSTDKAPKLDTGCIFRSSGPITFNIEIKRFLGPLKADGTLEDITKQKLIDNGLVSREIELIMPAFDVDSGANQPNVQPELDRVSVNGFEVGFLRGQNNQWVNNSFKIPIDKIKFANKGTGGGEPSGGINQIRIDIDTANSSESWCTSIDWGAMRFRAMSPVILIHGNGSDGCFFVRQGLVSEFENKGVVFDRSIQLNPNFDSADPCPSEKGLPTKDTNRVSVNGGKLNMLIPDIVRQFGARNVHLIAHSKGGLDAREYLAKYQRNHNQDFKVLSLTTLGTPHNGSVLADISITRIEALKNIGVLADDVTLENFPIFTQFVVEQIDKEGVDPGRYNLTTGFTNLFNLENLPLLDRNITFSTVAGDADTDSSESINNASEYRDLETENKDLRELFIGKQFVVNKLYQNLRLNKTVSTSIRRDCRVLPGGIVVCKRILVIRPVPNLTPLGNDTLVTLPSAVGAGSIQSITTNSKSFTGVSGRNHSNIANRGVAQTIFPWLIQIDRTKGGLR